MADDNSTRPSRAATTSYNAPSNGHTLRRATTMDEGARGRLRSPLSQDQSFEEAWRRNSSYSDRTSFSEAREKIRYQPEPVSSPETSYIAPLSLAFAMLPAFAGVFFKNGSAVVTDTLLLGVASVFLHASVTQPWAWYFSAQETRIQREADVEEAIEDDSDLESPTRADDEDVVEDDDSEVESKMDDGVAKKRRPKTKEDPAASKGLYRYEVFALSACLAWPLLAAYLLHAIRTQLSRPSEGLVSNYNLSIFVLIAELRVLRHVSDLFQARIHHLQREVQRQTYRGPSSQGKQYEELLERLDILEARSAAEENLIQDNFAVDSSGKSKQEVTLAKDVRNAIQPELDALNRAVRRYEKKATLLQSQTDSRFILLEARLEDAIALAAAAAKHSASQKNALQWIFESLLTIVLLPFNGILHVLLLPLKGFLAIVNRKQQRPIAKSSRPTRGGRVAAQARYSGDRIPTRVARR